MRFFLILTSYTVSGQRGHVPGVSSVLGLVVPHLVASLSICVFVHQAISHFGLDDLLFKNALKLGLPQG